ncbi:MAG: hypothetical protein IJM97_05215, partial [Clostridia bacterium]|nr:hypothetical protein [Clostridia bacterium]
ATKFKNCYVENVNVLNNYEDSTSSAGGLVGYSFKAATFENCYVAANIVNNNTTSERYRGGIIGRASKATGYASPIFINCFVAQDFTENAVTSLVGPNSSTPTITNSSLTDVETIKSVGMLENLGSAFGTEPVLNYNNGYHVLYWEDAEFDLRAYYVAETNSERINPETSGQIIAAFPELYAEYMTAYEVAGNIVTDDVIGDDTEAFAEALKNLKDASENLQKIYNKSELVILPWDGVSTREPENDGTNYYIYRADELAWLSARVIELATSAFKDCTIHLMKDIDLGGVNEDGSVNADKIFTPIGGRKADGSKNNDYNFNGTFEGNGHVIRNMYIYETNADINTGLFGCVSTAGIINELGIENSVISATGLSDATNYAIGALAGYINGGKVNNCFVRNSTVTAEQNYYVGGLVGTFNQGATVVSNCYVQNVNVTNNYENGTSCAGGIVGYTYSGSATINNCYVVANITDKNTTANKYRGGIVGRIATYACKINNTYFASDFMASDNPTSVTGTSSKAPTLTNSGAKTIAELKDAAILTSLNTGLDPAVYITDVNPAVNGGYPILWWEDPEYNLRELYNEELASERITYKEEIKEVFPELYQAYEDAMAVAGPIVTNSTTDDKTQIIEAYEELKATIEALYDAYYVSEDVVLPWNGEVMEPSNENETVYYIYRAEELAWLSDQVAAGTNDTDNRMTGKTFLLMKDIDLNGANHNWKPIGGRTSADANSTSNYFDGTFDGQGHIIKDMTVSATAYGASLFTYTFKNAVIKNVGIVNPTVSSTYTQTQYYTYGTSALVGMANGTDIDSCFVRGGTITASNMISVGGIVGGFLTTASNITNCYVEGTKISNTNATVAGANTGGIVGGNGSITGCVIENCYSTAVLTRAYTANDNAGAIIGILTSANYKITIRNCYGANDIGGMGDSLYGSNTNIGSITEATGGMLTSAQLKEYAPVLGSEFLTSTSADYNNGYPILWWEDPQSNLDSDTEDDKLLNKLHDDELYSDRWENIAELKELYPTEAEAYENAMNEAGNADSNSDFAALKTNLENAITALDEKAETYLSGKTTPWNGTTKEPENDGTNYYIYTAEELAWVSYNVSLGTAAANLMTGKVVYLMKDIDLNGSTYNWLPIGNRTAADARNDSYYFDGTFDGQGNVIKNMKVRATVYGGGLFAYTFKNAVIKNVGIIDPDVSSSFVMTSYYTYGTAALVGMANGTDIDSCFVRGGTVNATNMLSVGGIVGGLYATVSNITNCYVEGTEISNTYNAAGANAGGIVGASGSIAGNIIENCYSTAVLSSPYTAIDYLGAIIGFVTSTNYKMSIKNSYGAKDVGGRGDALYGAVNNIAYYNEVTGGMLTSAQLKNYSKELGEKFAPSTSATYNNGFPILWWEDPEFELNKVYKEELISERQTEKATLSANYPTEYAAYENAMSAAKTLSENGVVDNAEALNNAITTLTNA